MDIRDVKIIQLIQYSILQHYEVVDTPLLDFTHSLKIACSFAQMYAEYPRCFIYIVGFPYITNRITINSEHEIIAVRLLSICPPDALRPHYQEGYLAGTTDITYRYESKTELDFNQRLIAKFSIPSGEEFWRDGFEVIPKEVLYPNNDTIEKICADIKVDVDKSLRTGDVGDFLEEWQKLEKILIDVGRNLDRRNLSVLSMIKILSDREIISNDTAHELNILRDIRNKLVHESYKVSRPMALEGSERIKSILRNPEIDDLKTLR